MTHKNFVTQNSYENRTDNLDVTHGTSEVSITITPGQEYGHGISTHLSVEQARDLARTLLRFADSITMAQLPEDEAARLRAAAEQDLDALARGRHYLDHDGDAWYKTPEGRWLFDSASEVEDGTWGVGGATEDSARYFGPFKEA